jgi:hypothetical protein
MGRLFRLADGCGFIYVWFYEVVPRQRDPQEEIYKERRAGESQTAPCAKANWVLNLSAARRQVSPLGCEGRGKRRQTTLASAAISPRCTISQHLQVT